MKLRKILKNIKYKEIKGSQDIEISGICSDSRLVAPNNLFIAKKGTKFDAAEFIYEAVKAGAIAIVTQIYDPFLKNITQIICDDINLIEPDIAANFYNHPAKKLNSIAVTGTNGKTTTSYLIKHILDKMDNKCGLIGSIEYIINENKIPSTLTTPDVISIQKYLNEMVLSNIKFVCMEASSHGIDQLRLKNIDFKIAIFTNLGLDHLDYHLTFENYKNAKKKLFDSLNEKTYAIINIDDKVAKEIVMNTKANIVTYSVEKNADFFASDIEYFMDKTSFILNNKNEKIKISTSLIGKHNVYNILSAIAALVSLKFELKEIIDHINSFQTPRGRLEKVQNKKNLTIYVDHAHKPDALQNVLQILNKIKKGKIINVFGCGGDRDRSKRPLMAKISEKLSDISIVTSDNPRSEDPQKIIEEIVEGFTKNDYIIEKDRRKAIEIALKLAKEDDIIIITGKGHETYQIFKNVTIDFDDREVTKQISSIL